MPKYVHTLRNSGNTEFYLAQGAEAGVHAFDLDSYQKPALVGTSLLSNSMATSDLQEMAGYGYDTNGSVGNYYRYGVQKYDYFSGYGGYSASNSFSNSVGAAQGMKDDDNYYTTAIPFSFPFFGSNKTSFQISTNGAVFFDGAGTTSPTAGSEFINRPCMAVMWCDLRTDQQPWHDIYLVSNTTEMTVRWLGYTFGTTNTVSFSLTIKKTGDVIFKYEGSSGVNTTLPSPTIGMSNGSGQYFYQGYNGNTSLTGGVNDVGYTYSLSNDGMLDSFVGKREKLLEGVSTQWFDVTQYSGVTLVPEAPVYFFAPAEQDQNYQYVDYKTVGSDAVNTMPLSTYFNRTGPIALSDSVSSAWAGDYYLYQSNYNGLVSKWSSNLDQIRFRRDPVSPTPTPTPSVSTPASTPTPTP